MEQTLANQTWVITGATASLGQATALGLARRGATVVVLNRDAAKGEAMRAALVAASGNQGHAAYVADMADQAGLRRAAAEITAQHPRLNGLINNAGILLGRRQLTATGQEMVFAVNFLAPFLLTHLLLPALEAGAPGRVINLATWRHPPVEFDDLNRERRYESQAVYAQSKTALVMFTQALARRVPGLRVNAINPGFLRTSLGTGLTGMNWLFLKVIAPRTMMGPAEKGAGRVLRLTDAPELAGVTGEFIYEEKIAPPFQVEPSAADRERLWRLGEKLTSLDTTTPA